MVEHAVITRELWAFVGHEAENVETVLNDYENDILLHHKVWPEQKKPAVKVSNAICFGFFSHLYFSAPPKINAPPRVTRFSEFVTRFSEFVTRFF